MVFNRRTGAIGLGAALAVELLSGCATAGSEAAAPPSAVAGAEATAAALPNGGAERTPPTPAATTTGAVAVGECVGLPPFTAVTSQQGNYFRFTEQCTLAGQTDQPLDELAPGSNLIQPGEDFDVQCVGPTQAIVIKPPAEGRGELALTVPLSTEVAAAASNGSLPFPTCP